MQDVRAGHWPEQLMRDEARQNPWQARTLVLVEQRVVFGVMPEPSDHREGVNPAWWIEHEVRIACEQQQCGTNHRYDQVPVESIAACGWGRRQGGICRSFGSWSVHHDETLLSRIHQIGTVMLRRRPMRLLAVIAVASLLAACARSDDRIREDVIAGLRGDPATSRLDLSVHVNRRIVFLSGKTSAYHEQQKALDTARAVRSVRLVVNDMWLNDPVLAGKVQTALGADPALAGVPIEVHAQSGTVRLISNATNEDQRERAVRIAAAVEGVKRVENGMK